MVSLVESVFGAQLLHWYTCVFIRCKPLQLLFPVCSALLKWLCRKCQGLASFPQPSLSALLFFSSVSPLRPTPLYLSEKRNAKPALKALMLAPQLSTTKFAPASARPVFFQTSRHPHMCTPALDQRLLWSSWAGEATAELSISQPTFLGVGRKQECCSGGTWVFLFLASSRPSTPTAVSLLLLLWQSSVRNSLSLCTSQKAAG